MQDLPDISVLIPSRGRPQNLLRCLQSLGTHSNVEILVATDDDDPSEYRAVLPSTVKHFTGPRPRTLGICINELAARAKGQLLFFFGDDQILTAPDWPDRLMQAAEKLPNGIGVLYPRCAFHSEGLFASLPIISRQVYEHVGYYMAPYFPFWFIDTWWDEIGEFLGLKAQVDLGLLMPEGKGKTHGLTDLYFWVDFFDASRGLRVAEATKLAKFAFGEDSALFRTFSEDLPLYQCISAARVAHMRTQDYIDFYKHDAPPSERYKEVKIYAEKLLQTLRKDKGPKVPWAVPLKVRTSLIQWNAFCPCGSGERYTDCHGIN